MITSNLAGQRFFKLLFKVKDKICNKSAQKTHRKSEEHGKDKHDIQYIYLPKIVEINIPLIKPSKKLQCGLYRS